MKTKDIPIKQRLCISCRRCCKSIGIYVDPGVYAASQKDLVRFYRARGFKIYKRDHLLLFIHNDFPCPNLTQKGCKIYRKRPNVCRNYSGIEDFGKDCLWADLPEDTEKKKCSAKAGKKRK